MPQLIQFISKVDGKPVGFAAIDDAMRQAFNEPADDKQFLWGWYDAIGEALAIASRFGKDDPMVEVAEQYKDNEKGTKVMKFLAENYTFNSWREYK